MMMLLATITGIVHAASLTTDELSYEATISAVAAPAQSQAAEPKLDDPVVVEPISKASQGRTEPRISPKVRAGYEWVKVYLETTYPDQTSPEVLRIIGAESEFIPEAANAICCAEGLFQITDGSWKTYAPKVFGDDWVNRNKLDIDDNFQVGAWMYYNEGNHHWDESRSVWEL